MPTAIVLLVTTERETAMNAAANITWTYETNMSRYLAHFELDVRCEFESGFKGTVSAWIELFYGNDGSRETRAFILEGENEKTTEFHSESGAKDWEWEESVEWALDPLYASGAIVFPSVSVAA